jgi:hypothetical protein
MTDQQAIEREMLPTEAEANAVHAALVSELRRGARSPG